MVPRRRGDHRLARFVRDLIDLRFLITGTRGGLPPLVFASEHLVRLE